MSLLMAATLKKPPGAPKYTYTGSAQIVHSTHPTKGTPRFYIRFLTSGTLTLDRQIKADLFGVGGGGAGDTGGGGGGYTTTVKNATLKAYANIAITIGAGGATNDVHGKNTTVVQTTTLLSAAGGKGASVASGGAGGSGGGARTGRGGSNGSNGSVNGAGTGQGTTTYAFAGDVNPFNTANFLYSGGGSGLSQLTPPTSSGGRRYMDPIPGGAGGGGDGYGSKGSIHYSAQPGETNRGGGGGGGGASGGGNASGGSGIVILRWGDWSA